MWGNNDFKTPRCHTKSDGEVYTDDDDEGIIKMSTYSGRYLLWALGQKYDHSCDLGGRGVSVRAIHHSHEAHLHKHSLDAGQGELNVDFPTAKTFLGKTNQPRPTYLP